MSKKKHAHRHATQGNTSSRKGASGQPVISAAALIAADPAAFLAASAASAGDVGAMEVAPEASTEKRAATSASASTPTTAATALSLIHI